jgi:16S rRNA (cytosine967-C5)-methyltransferase
VLRRPRKSRPGNRSGPLLGQRRSHSPRKPEVTASRFRRQDHGPAGQNQLGVTHLAERIIRAASRERAADAVLRAELRGQSGLSAEAAAQVSRAVFTWFRWRGWLDKTKPFSDQIEFALALAERFSADPGGFGDVDLAARAVPDWVQTVMETPPAWLRALQTEPKLWLRARRGQGRALADRLDDCRILGEGPLSDILEYQGRADLFRTSEFHAGEFELQDISSQAVGLICHPRAGEKWWDACAGEGGKLLHLADLMENQGLIWASDRAGWRLTKLKRRAARARVFNYRATPWDGGSRLPTKTAFDGVLVDAPCSCIGTWQRNPHARWTTTLQDVKELSELQTQLLLNASASVKPGGRLLYATCTLTHLETMEVVTAFERLSSGFERMQIVNPLAPDSSPQDLLFLWPQDTAGNGMFVAGWIRAGYSVGQR